MVTVAELVLDLNVLHDWTELFLQEQLWIGSTSVKFSDEDRKQMHHFDAVDNERIFACQGCEKILFQGSEGVYETSGTGQMKLPAGIQVRGKGGFAKCIAL
jgi:hypothetical protein